MRPWFWVELAGSHSTLTLNFFSNSGMIDFRISASLGPPKPAMTNVCWACAEPPKTGSTASAAAANADDHIRRLLLMGHLPVLIEEWPPRPPCATATSRFAFESARAWAVLPDRRPTLQQVRGRRQRAGNVPVQRGCMAVSAPHMKATIARPPSCAVERHGLLALRAW